MSKSWNLICSGSALWVVLWSCQLTRAELLCPHSQFCLYFMNEQKLRFYKPEKVNFIIQRKQYTFDKFPEDRSNGRVIRRLKKMTPKILGLVLLAFCWELVNFNALHSGCQSHSYSIKFLGNSLHSLLYQSSTVLKMLSLSDFCFLQICHFDNICVLCYT